MTFGDCIRQKSDEALAVMFVYLWEHPKEYREDEHDEFVERWIKTLGEEMD